MNYSGDFTAGATVALPFETQINGALAAVSSLAVALFDLTAPTVAITAGITLTQNVNSVTGSHLASVDTSNVAYAPGKDYILRPTAGTVNGVSVIGIEVGAFSLKNRSTAAIQTKTDLIPASPASTTNITAGTITTVTNLTNLPAAAALEASLQSLITTVAALNNLSAAGVRTSVGLATANLDTQLAALAAYIDTEVAALLAAVSDLQARTPAALTADGNMKADTLRISGSATAADNLEEGSKALVTGTCAAGCTTTSIVTNLTEATDNHYNGRVITFTGGALLGQTTSISDYVGATKTLTVVALTEAAASGDPFVIS